MTPNGCSNVASLLIAALLSRASRFVAGEGRPAPAPQASRPPTNDGPRPPARDVPAATDEDLSEYAALVAESEQLLDPAAPLPYDPDPLDGTLVTDGSWCALTGCPNRGDIYRNKVPWCLVHHEAGSAIAHLEAHFGARA